MAAAAVGLQMRDRENFTVETYTKLYINSDGEVYRTTLPQRELFDRNKTSEWQLEKNDSHSWVIIYNRNATKPNPWWEENVMKFGKDFPVIQGDFCVHIHFKPLDITNTVLARELVRYMETHYHRKSKYKFCLE